MKHMTETGLDQIQPLLQVIDDLAAVHDVLKPRKRGVYYLKSRAFLHFHQHEGDIYADVRLDGVEFARFKVTTQAEQRELVSRIKGAVNA